MPSIALSIRQPVQKRDQSQSRPFVALLTVPKTHRHSYSTHAPTKGDAPEKKRGKSCLSNLKLRKQEWLVGARVKHATFAYKRDGNNKINSEEAPIGLKKVFGMVIILISNITTRN